MIVSPVAIITQRLCECFTITGRPCPAAVIPKGIAVTLLDRKVGTILTMHPTCARQIRLVSARVKPVVSEA